MPNTDAVIFCRVSTKDQFDRWSSDIQEEAARKYAKAKRLQVKEVINVPESGYKGRKHFQAMLRYIREYNIGHLVTLNSDRLTRDMQGLIDVDKMIQERGLSVHFFESREVIDINTTRDQKSLWKIKVIFAENFIGDLQEKARRSIEARLDQGLYPFGNPPLGYVAKLSHLTPNDKEIPFVKKAFELYATGLESEYSVTEKLYTEGLRTRKGRKVGVNTIADLLHSPVPLGYVVWPFDDSKYVTRKHSKGEWIPAQHPPIIDRPLWDKVQEVLKENGRPHPQNGKFFLARGLLWCGVCGKMMTPYYSKGHAYYASNHPRGSRCSHKTCYREELVAKKFDEALGRFSFPPDLYVWMKQVLKENNTEQRQTTQSEKKRLDAERKHLETNIEKALDEALEGIFDRQLIQKKVRGYRDRLDQIKGQVSRLDKGRVEAVDDALLILDLIQDLKGAFAKSDPEQRHRLLKIIFKSVIVTDGKFDFRVNEPFSALYEIRLGKPHMWRA